MRDPWMPSTCPRHTAHSLTRRRCPWLAGACLPRIVSNLWQLSLPSLTNTSLPHMMCSLMLHRCPVSSRTSLPRSLRRPMPPQMKSICPLHNTRSLLHHCCPPSADTFLPHSCDMWQQQSRHSLGRTCLRHTTHSLSGSHCQLSQGTCPPRTSSTCLDLPSLLRSSTCQLRTECSLMPPYCP